MGFWHDWYQFIKENAISNMKRFSIVIGSFLVLIITSIPLGLNTFLIIVYAGIIEASSIIIMTLFGKNGNGNNHNKLIESNVEKTPNNN
ncbi:unnamed protein product [marine sediment metagenome]|uniref:Uncharacterized protein n=1 Tax=marine sediment metagenome TaxID=412755 RepID=X1C2G1_9ZZZZ